MLRLLIIALAATAAVAEVDRFDGYKVFAVTPNTTAQLSLLREFAEPSNGVSYVPREIDGITLVI